MTKRKKIIITILILFIITICGLAIREFLYILETTSVMINFKSGTSLPREEATEDILNRFNGSYHSFYCHVDGVSNTDVKDLYKASNMFGNEFQKSNKACTSDMICKVINNQNGELETKVCNKNNVCLIQKYYPEKNIIDICYHYNENGVCTCGGEVQYDKNGKLLTERKCKEWDTNGYCTSSLGSIISYDSKGRLISKAYCENWNKNKNCDSWRYNGSMMYIYDDKDIITGFAKCKTYNNDGTCDLYDFKTCYRNSLLGTGLYYCYVNKD